MGDPGGNRGFFGSLGLCLILILFCWLDSDLAHAKNPKGRRILVLVEEGFASLHKSPRATERYLRSLLQKEGFHVIDERQANEIKKRAEIYHFMQGDPDGALAASLRHETDFVIRGRGMVQSGTAIGASKLKPRHASVSIDLFSTRNAIVLYSTTSSGTYPHIDELQGGIEALKLAVDASFGQLLATLTPGSDSSGKQSAVTEIVISGLEDVTEYRKIGDQLGKHGYSLDAIRFVHNTGHYRISGGNTSKLPQYLSRLVIGNRIVEISEMSPGSIKAKLTKVAVY